MKTALVCLLALVSSQFFTPDTTWYTFETEEIRIEFPKEPALSKQMAPTAVGDIEMNIASYDASRDGDSTLAYVFISSVYPDSMLTSIKKEEIPAFFRASIDGAVKNVSGQLISEKEVTLNGFPGREARIDFGNGTAVIYLHMYLVRNTGYFIQTITETGKVENQAALRFHRSFRLKK